MGEWADRGRRSCSTMEGVPEVPCDGTIQAGMTKEECEGSGVASNTRVVGPDPTGTTCTCSYDPALLGNRGARQKKSSKTCFFKHDNRKPAFYKFFDFKL